MSDQSASGKRPSLRLKLATALLTAGSIAGAIFAIFWALIHWHPPQFMADLPAFVSIPLGLPVIAGPLLVGGAVWGAIIARLVGREPITGARTGALAVTGTVLVLEVPVHMSQLLPLPGWFPFGLHGVFTLEFMLEVALVAGLASARLAKRLCLPEPRRIGTQVGLAGALGFAFGSLISVALGFIVGQPPSTNMVWALQIANLAAGLAAGWQLGNHLPTANPVPANHPGRQGVAVNQ